MSSDTSAAALVEIAILQMVVEGSYAMGKVPAAILPVVALIRGPPINK
jgi:hypothetical protein